MAAAEKQPETSAAWNTIHIFGYGESQVIGMNHNGTIANSELKGLTALLAGLAEKQQKGTEISLENAHAINIFNNAFIDFIPKEKPKNKRQRFAWSEVDAKLLQKFSDELVMKLPERQQRKEFGIQKNQNNPILKKIVIPDFKKNVSAKPKQDVKAKKGTGK